MAIRLELQDAVATIVTPASRRSFSATIAWRRYTASVL
jgi:hypothetical protein